MRRASFATSIVLALAGGCGDAGGTFRLVRYTSLDAAGEPLTRVDVDYDAGGHVVEVTSEPRFLRLSWWGDELSRVDEGFIEESGGPPRMFATVTPRFTGGVLEALETTGEDAGNAGTITLRHDGGRTTSIEGNQGTNTQRSELSYDDGRPTAIRQTLGSPPDDDTDTTLDVEYDDDGAIVGVALQSEGGSFRDELVVVDGRLEEIRRSGDGAQDGFADRKVFAYDDEGRVTFTETFAGDVLVATADVAYDDGAAVGVDPTPDELWCLDFQHPIFDRRGYLFDLRGHPTDFDPALLDVRFAGVRW